MTKAFNALKGKKSYIVASVSVVYAVVVVGWQGGDWGAASEVILAALGLAGLRDAIK